MGPNTATGHLSVIFSSECQINFSLRLLQPIIGRGLSPFSVRPDAVSVTLDAEKKENIWIQSAAKKLVWASGCTSWYIDALTGRNTMLYPDWQFKYWLRSYIFPRSDFVYESATRRLMGTSMTQAQSRLADPWFTSAAALTASVLSCVVIYCQGTETVLGWLGNTVSRVTQYYSHLTM
jgi:hypothetical protein